MAGRGGRPKGVLNRSSIELKDMIRGALDGVGGKEYLMQQAKDNPTGFMTLIGKIIPADVRNTVTGADGGDVKHSVKVEFINGKA